MAAVGTGAAGRAQPPGRIGLPGIPIGWDETATTSSDTEANRGYRAVDEHFGPNQLHPDVVTIETNHDILSKLSGKDNAQAVVGVFPEFTTPLAQLDRAASPIWLVAERLRDPGNLGTILRTGDAVGAGGLILIDDCVDQFSVEAVRASMGALFTVPIAQARWEEFVPWLRSGPGQLVGLSLQTESDYRAVSYTSPTFLLTGNEAQGLPEAYETKCDLLVKLPMLGKADSLNAAVATAVMAYEVLAQTRG